jgi:hypothetical protein
MSNIYDIDFSQQGPELIPPDKRDSGTISLVNALLKAMQWCRDLLFTSYKTGATAPAYATGTYDKYDMVIFEKGVYYSLIAGNTDLPTVETSWLKVQDNFLGADQRVKFNGQSIVLEYALNQRFGGVFRPPGSSSHSDIYFNKLVPVISGFIVAQTEDYSSTVGQTDSDDKIGLRYPFVRLHNFQINVLNSVYVLTNEQAIRDFANLYVPISINYTVVPY